jgi:hypothetical protein
VGHSASALRELFLLQLLHRDAARRKGCPYIVTPLSIVKSAKVKASIRCKINAWRSHTTLLV